MVLDTACGEQTDSRNKAVRLTANKLFAEPHLQGPIKSFAHQTLLKLTHVTSSVPSATSCMDQDSSSKADAGQAQPLGLQQPQEDLDQPQQELQQPQQDLPLPQQDLQQPQQDPSPQAATAGQHEHSSEADGTRLAGLYCALCTKDAKLLRDLLLVYGSAAEGCQRAIESVAAGRSGPLMHALPQSIAMGRPCLFVYARS